MTFKSKHSGVGSAAPSAERHRRKIRSDADFSLIVSVRMKAAKQKQYHIPLNVPNRTFVSFFYLTPSLLADEEVSQFLSPGGGVDFNINSNVAMNPLSP